MNHENHTTVLNKESEQHDLQNLFSQFAQDSPKCKYLLFHGVLHFEEEKDESKIYGELSKVWMSAKTSLENTLVGKQISNLTKTARTWKLKPSY